MNDSNDFTLIRPGKWAFLCVPGFKMTHNEAKSHDKWLRYGLKHADMEGIYS